MGFPSLAVRTPIEVHQRRESDPIVGAGPAAEWNFPTVEGLDYRPDRKGQPTGRTERQLTGFGSEAFWHNDVLVTHFDSVLVSAASGLVF